MNVLTDAITEAEFQRTVTELAEWNGWLHYHTHDSRRANPGFPDLVLVHPRKGLVIFAELKSERGRVRPEQRAWLRALTEAGAEAHLWRPSDLDSIIERLA